MDSFSVYLNNLNLWAILDFIIVIAFAGLITWMFIRKNNVRLAIYFALYFVLMFLILILNALTKSHILTVTKYLLIYINFFIIVVLVVIYQNDLKLLINKIGRPKDWQTNLTSDDVLIKTTKEISKAIFNLSKNNIGAIIVISKGEIPHSIIDTGTVIDAEVSYGLIESIFNTKSPLHDGALVMNGEKLIAAGCFLPLSENLNISKDLGTRHRAAIGLTEQNNALAIVVSEETGIISTALTNEFNRYVTVEKLTEQLHDTFGLNHTRR